MNLLVALAPTLIWVLIGCSLYFSWKARGGSIIDFKKQPMDGAGVLGWLMLFLGYIGFSIGLTAIAALGAFVTRVLLVIAAFGAFAQGDASLGTWALVVAAGTLALSVTSLLTSPIFRKRS